MDSTGARKKSYYDQAAMGTPGYSPDGRSTYSPIYENLDYNDYEQQRLKQQNEDMRSSQMNKPQRRKRSITQRRPI